MITDKVIEYIEESLDGTFDAHIVPEKESYPTSGSTFISVSGTSTNVSFHDQSISFAVNFVVQCSIRTRDFVTQNKQTPYKALLDLQERCFLVLMQDTQLIENLRQIVPRGSVIGRITSSFIDTNVQILMPEFYGSQDRSSIREAGYLLSQSYSAPTIRVPIDCFELPSPLNVGIP